MNEPNNNGRLHPIMWVLFVVAIGFLVYIDQTSFDQFERMTATIVGVVVITLAMVGSAIIVLWFITRIMNKLFPMRRK